LYKSLRSPLVSARRQIASPSIQISGGEPVVFCSPTLKLLMASELRVPLYVVVADQTVPVSKLRTQTPSCEVEGVLPADDQINACYDAAADSSRIESGLNLKPVPPELV
jgi:hypothetical protein